MILGKGSITVSSASTTKTSYQVVGVIGVADVTPPSGVVEAAQKTLDELTDRYPEMWKIMGEAGIPSETSREDQPMYWLGRLEGVIMTLLACLPDEGDKC